jgi:hypothetical protein
MLRQSSAPAGGAISIGAGKLRFTMVVTISSPGQWPATANRNGQTVEFQTDCLTTTATAKVIRA